MSKTNKHIKIAAIISYITIVVNIISGLVYTPWMIDQIGKPNFGLFTLTTSIIAFFAFDFGLGEAITRFLSKLLVDGEKEKEKIFLRSMFKAFLLINIGVFIAFAIVYVFAGQIYGNLTPEELSIFKTLFLIAGLYAVASFPFKPLDGVLYSHERYIFSKTLALAHKLLLLATTIGLLYFGQNVLGLVIASVTTGLVILIIKIIYIARNKLVNINTKEKDIGLIKNVLFFSVWTTIIALSQRLIYNLSPSIIAAISGSVAVAIFGIASTLEGYTWSLANALNGLFLPKITRILKQPNAKSIIEKLMIKIGRFQLTIIGLIISGFVILGQEFITIWVGPDFLDAYYVTILILAPLLVTLTQQIAVTTLVAKGDIKYRAIGTLISGVVSIGATVIFVYFFGVIGAGYGIFLGLISGHVIYMNYIYKKKLEINISKFFVSVHLRYLPLLAITIGIGFLTKWIITPTGWFTLAADAAIISLIYSIIAWFIYFSGEDRVIIIGRFSRKSEPKIVAIESERVTEDEELEVGEENHREEPPFNSSSRD